MKDKENDIFILVPELGIQGIKLCQLFSPFFFYFFFPNSAIYDHGRERAIASCSGRD